MKNCLKIICLFFLLSYKSFATDVILNGKKVSVYFNDGDTFKVLDGKYKNKRARIDGFNSLENYGPVHSFADATKEYLYEMSNNASKHARSGSWNCSLKDGKDTYGRLLVVCDDLAHSLIINGLAHAFSIDNSSAKSSYVQLQKQAIANKVGMWKFGAPEYIVTSLHSKDENGKDTYNRVISTNDGHTREWKHNDVYKTCETVCLKDEKSCMVYVAFNQRYGDYKPECLLTKSKK